MEASVQEFQELLSSVTDPAALVAVAGLFGRCRFGGVSRYGETRHQSRSIQVQVEQGE